MYIRTKISMIRPVLFVILFITSYLNAQIDDYRFDNISSLDGLSNSSVIAIHQDQFGQIWFGTRDGLNMFDGNHFTVYRNNPEGSNSISNNDILSIHEDSFGSIWIGTYDGLNRFDPYSKTFKRFIHNNKTNSVNDNTIRTIFEINREIWIGTNNGLAIYNIEENSFLEVNQNIKNGNGINGSVVNCILQDKKGNIWIGTSKGLSKLISRNNNEFKFKYYEVNEDNINVVNIVEDNNSNLMIATTSGLYKINTETGTFSSLSKTKFFQTLDNDIRALQYDNDDNLWIGTSSGVYLLTPNNILKSLPNKSSDLNQVKCIFKDKAGSFWIGTYYAGISFWDKSNNNFGKINLDKLSSKVISSIESDANGNLYFGTVDTGITVYNPQTQKTEFINESNTLGLSSNHIKSLFISDNELWIGTLRTGLTIYNLKTKGCDNDRIPKELSDLLKIGLYSIKKDKQNNLWFGTFGNGLIRYNQSNNTWLQIRNDPTNVNSISNNRVRINFIDSKNRIWVGTQSGLNSFSIGDIGQNNFKINRYFFNERDSKFDIQTVFEDTNHNIWVGTKSKGLYLFNENSFEKIELINGKSEITSIHGILEDENKNLWLSSNKGIAQLNPANNKLIIYNQADGLQSKGFNDNSCLKYNPSLFYFGGNSGVSSFDPKNILTNNYTPEVILTDFKINNETIEVNDKNEILKKNILFTKNIELAYDQANFSIGFSIPNFINNSKNKYSIRLLGLNDQWAINTSGQASYTIQTPGDYIFEVKGFNNDGKWNQKITQLNITVQPAPWLSWWAFTIYFLLIGSAIFYVIKFFKSRENLKYELELESFQNKKIEETNKAKIDFFTSISHEFRTPLTLIIGSLQQLIENYKGSNIVYKKLLIIENSSNHLLKLINRLMDFRKLESNLLKLQAAEGNMVKFIREIYLSFTEYAKVGNYTYNFTTTDKEIFVYYDRLKLERVLYNLISNAFRYTPKGGTINVEVSKNDNFILIAVKDTGVGISEKYFDEIFDKFFEIPIHNNPEGNYNKGVGIGLSIVKKLVALHKGNITVENNNPHGAIFTIAIPLGRDHLSENEIFKDFKISDELTQYQEQLNDDELRIDMQLESLVKDNDKSTILIAEDNLQLRLFLRDFLKPNYNIIDAENGKIAFEKALKYTPDLIISDVIMPEMEGTELCRKIKENLKTSHIPVILLTSRSTLVYKIEGFENGADDYISKPFNLKEFRFRVNNILESNKRLKLKFTNDDYLTPSEITISSLDEKLFKKAFEIVETNIANQQFDIPKFCLELGVSRTLLFSKIKVWTNLTPNEFINEIRMKRAIQLLEQNKLSVSEIGYKVGFNSPKYFSKCFQKKFGKTPTKYLKKFHD
ncbi:two-component regulator propeller domain-containing protein [Gaetbulibacter sp. M240]|uniref:hybrid sensor histidine kinase/response regulator transcription factor n=1 Tax=Gaetbulibacter sp. M240 TaxID=3126511 RepID=UPI00374E2B84